MSTEGINQREQTTWRRRLCWVFALNGVFLLFSEKVFYRECKWSEFNCSKFSSFQALEILEQDFFFSLMREMSSNDQEVGFCFGSEDWDCNLHTSCSIECVNQK